MARLVCTQGPLEGQVFDIEAGLTIGRGTHNSIPMPQDRKASRDHAKVWKSGATQFAVADLGSTNGTLVNDGPVSRADLKDGDAVQVGEAVFRFELSADEQPKPKIRPVEKRSQRDDLAAMLRGEKAAAAPVGGAGAIEFKSRILQYSQKGSDGTALGVDVSQTAGPLRWLFVALALAVAFGLFMLVKTMMMSGEPARPGAVPSEEGAE